MLQESKARASPFDWPADATVLSIYVDTDGATGLGNDKRERLRFALDKCREAVMDKKERATFDVARGWAEDYLGAYRAPARGRCCSMPQVPATRGPRTSKSRCLGPASSGEPSWSL